jgi:hypothetical protein
MATLNTLCSKKGRLWKVALFFAAERLALTFLRSYSRNRDFNNRMSSMVLVDVAR